MKPGDRVAIRVKHMSIMRRGGVMVWWLEWRWRPWSMIKKRSPCYGGHFSSEKKLSVRHPVEPIRFRFQRKRWK
jgi:hypothetical protein